VQRRKTKAGTDATKTTSTKPTATLSVNDEFGESLLVEPKALQLDQLQMSELTPAGMV
jgi:C4-type Zn-finger protein